MCRVCTECGRTLQDSAGEFGWPPPPPVHEDSDSSSSSSSSGVAGSMAEPCQWRISGTHGERIIVNVSELRLASDDCVTDYLELRDGHWYRSPLVGQHAPSLFVFSSRSYRHRVVSMREVMQSPPSVRPSVCPSVLPL